MVGKPNDQSACRGSERVAVTGQSMYRMVAVMPKEWLLSSFPAANYGIVDSGWCDRVMGVHFHASSVSESCPFSHYRGIHGGEIWGLA